MFPWNIAKSAEEFLCRYAVKRLCKFLLKKKLGQFILGDIDLNQLDVQLSAGLLQLSDLALNVDYLNQKLSQTSILRVKEGSIRSLLVKMPWNGESCEVEVDELELVLFPCYKGNSHEVVETHSNDDFCERHDMGTVEHDAVYNSSTSATAANVHVGVKTVATMVKWLLTSFCIRISSVIVAFDVCLERDKEEEGCRDVLVLRAAEIECGACISEESGSIDGGNPEDFLGISQLINFLKFKGAIIELLQMNNGYNQTQPASQTALLGCYLPNASKPLFTGEKGGFCGTMKLSINGSLDTHKVDADVNVETLIMKFQPSTLKWILDTWELLENYEKSKVDVNHTAETFFSDCTSHCTPSILLTSILHQNMLVQLT